MSGLPRVTRFLLPVLVVLLSCIGACAMYDVTAFEAEGWEEDEQLEDVGDSDSDSEDPEDPEEPEEEPEEPEDGPECIATSALSITLTWDAPDSPVTSYRIHYSEHEFESWIPLDEIPTEEPPEYEVIHSSVGNGSFDFAVTSVYAGQESDMHTSLDGTATPDRGWYVEWQRNE